MSATRSAQASDPIASSSSTPCRLFSAPTTPWRGSARGCRPKTDFPPPPCYVFVNMLRKLRDDFSPEYLAAVFDVARQDFPRDAGRGHDHVRKFDIKTQTFTEMEYKGYKANRAAMPEDLAQQIPVYSPRARSLSHSDSRTGRLRSRRCDRHSGPQSCGGKHPVYIVSSATKT